VRFEDLEVWKRSARLSVELYKELRELRDYGFRDQITRSGLSVPSNIAEGIERSSDNEVIRFATIARGSCGELRAQIYIGMEIGYIKSEIGKAWLQETRELSAMLGGLIKARKQRGQNDH
jgi:four helix bundle protein